MPKTKAELSDLSKLKKGDFVAVVRSGGTTHPTRATKTVVLKKNPASIIIEHEGKEVRVDLRHSSIGYQVWVEVWDDEAETARVRDGLLLVAKQAIWTQGAPVYPMSAGKGTVEAADVVREPEKFTELVRLREEYERRTMELCREILASRPSES